MYLRRKKSTTDLLKQRLGELTETLGDLAAELSGKAAVALGPTVLTAREAASSAYDQASLRVREDVVPRVRVVAAPAVGAALARPQTVEVVEEPEQSHRLRTLLILLGLGGVAAYAAKKFGIGSGASQSSSFGQASPSGSSYAGTTSSGAPTGPTAVPDADSELGHDVTDEFSEDSTGADTSGFSTEFTTRTPTEAYEAGSGSDSESKPTP